MMKYSHVIPCPFEVCNLEYNKIVFDNGYVSNVGNLNGIPPCATREYDTRTSVSPQCFTEYDNGESVCNCEWWLVGRKGDRLVIRYTSHGGLDRFGNFYSSSHIFETDNLNWFEKRKTDKQ